MTRIPNLPRMPPQAPKPRPRRRPRRFRREILVGIAALLAVPWIFKNIRPGLACSEVMSRIGIHAPERFTRLAILCCVGIGLVWIVKILHDKKENE